MDDDLLPLEGGREVRHARARPPRPVGGDGGEATRQLVAPEVYEDPPACFSRKGVSRSIGAGKTIVEAFVAPISSSVCR